MTDLQSEWIAALRRGDHAAAFAVNDTVLAGRDRATRDDATAPYHLRWVWDGCDLRRKHVLVRNYHGLGDTLQFARFLPAAHELARELAVEVQPDLLPLVASMGAADRLIPFRPAAPAPPSDCDVEIMELPHALRLSPDRCRPPYLPLAAPSRSGLIGLCWQAGGWDSERSIPAALMAPLTRWRCVSLAPEPCELPVVNPTGCPAVLADTARLIAGLDLIITVDTMVAHLAGAMNRPTWLLLKHDADWRWMGDATRSAWYPSMRLYRQPEPGNWPAVVAQVVADLAR